MCLTHLCSLYIQPRHLDCLAKMRGFKTAKNARHQAFTLSMCCLYWFGLLVLQPFLLLFSFFILCCFWLSFFGLSSIFFIFRPRYSCFWSLFWCLTTLDVCAFSASSASVSLSAHQLFCPSSLFHVVPFGVLPSFALVSVPLCSRFLCFSCGHLPKCFEGLIGLQGLSRKCKKPFKHCNVQIETIKTLQYLKGLKHPRFKPSKFFKPIPTF